jgi:hypothetical protein
MQLDLHGLSHGSGSAEFQGQQQRLSDAPILTGLTMSKSARDIHKSNLQAWASSSELGTIIRGETPARLLQYAKKSTKYVSVLPDGATEAQIAARDAELRKISQLNAEDAKYMNQAIRQAKIVLAAHMYKAMAQHAKPLVDSWRLKHALDVPPAGEAVDLTITDGIKIYKELLAFLDRPATAEDLAVHEAGVAAYGRPETKVPDNVSVDQWSTRINAFQTDHNRMLGPRELTGKILSQFYISQLPANMLSLGVSLSCRLTKQDRWDDAPYVYEQCIFMIAQMHKRTAAPAVMVTINLAGEVVIPIIPVAVAEYKRDKRDRSGAGKSGGGRDSGGGGRDSGG